ncbi:DEAD/DEAH box helicase [Acidobacteriia bacterium AH_259_A11_L15]|nr:DEAD/DEAH box helicase [Acidobacteriia bacterium AH_259_A11_L15]
MPIDLGRLTSKTLEKRPVNPLEIWNQLDRAVGKEYFRPIQEKVLDLWFARRETEDIIIKMNTGTGKTLVGLLALQSSLHEGYGPALYICPDNYMVSQVLEQAEQFGVRCVSFANAARDTPASFVNSEAILVANCKKFFNGRSVFGIEGGPRPPVNVGAIVLDDAHACIEQIRSQFTIALGADSKPYGQLLTLFAPSLRQQRPGTFAEIEAGDYSSMAVPYWNWLESQSQIVQILSKHRESDELRFVWPLLKNILPNCECIISGTHLQITPRVVQTQLFPSFAKSRRRIYLSATLLDDSQLARDLGIPISSIQQQIKPNEFDDLGERLILLPSDVNPQLSTTFVMDLLKRNKKINRIVLVPTKRDSERWQEVGATPVLAANIAKELGPLKSSKGAFLALIAKYDGIDLPDDVCRLLVLDSLPRGATIYDRYIQSVLLGSPTFNAKIAQRIEQGLGRATRGKSDYCVVLVTGNDIVTFLRDKSNRHNLAPGTNAQLELGLAVTKEIRESVEDSEYPKALLDEIRRCLRRDDEWKAFYRSYIEAARDQVPAGAEKQVPLEIAATEHRAAGHFLRREYDRAESEVRQILDQAELTDRERGWFLQLAAAYAYPANKSQGMSMQRKAYELNSSLFVPPQGVKYQRMAEHKQSQSAQALQFVLSHGNLNEFVLHANAICDRLTFGIESELFEQGLEDIAKVVGIDSSRPEKTLGKGPDCLWRGDTGNVLIIEAKSEIEENRKVIYKRESQQLLHSYEWFKQEYVGKTGLPLIFHRATRLDHGVVFIREGRIVTPDYLDDFTSRVRSYVTAVASQEGARLMEALVREQLQANRLVFSQCFASAKKPRKNSK